MTRISVSRPGTPYGTRVKSRAPADFCSTVHDVLSLPMVWMSPERRPSQSAAWSRPDRSGGAPMNFAASVPPTA